VNHGTHFTVDVEIGTPGQPFSVVADTGSNTLIVPSCICQEAGRCSLQDRCFVGTNRSSTFALPGGQARAPAIYMSFGSGSIGGVVVRDNASVGLLRAYMRDGLVLMTDRALSFGGPFEGVLGLGPPRRRREAPARAARRASAEGGSVGDALRDVVRRIVGAEGAAGAAEDAAPAAAPTYVGLGRNAQMPGGTEPAARMPPGFLEQAGIGRFSMCFNYEAEGVLRLGTPPSSSAHGSLGTAHWGLGLWGISVGTTSVPVHICSPEDKGLGQKSPCGAIPDSGTTFIMAPKDHIAALLDSVCDQWPRCSQNHSAMVKAAQAADEAMVRDYGIDPFDIAPLPKGAVAKLLLMDCDAWMGEAGGLGELPPISFHVQGSSGTRQTLSLPARAYVVRSQVNASTARKLNISTSKRQVCYPALGAMEYTTADNGPVWILGTPLFYEFNVGYDMLATPPAMSFTSVEAEPCGSCDRKAGLVSTRSTPGGPDRPRTISGVPRLPSSIDLERPM